MPKFVKIECHLHGEKNRSTFKIFRKLSAQELLIITSLDGFRNSKIGYFSTEADLTLPLPSFSLPTPFTRGRGAGRPPAMPKIVIFERLSVKVADIVIT